MESRRGVLIRDLRPSTLFPSQLKFYINLCLVDVPDLHGLGVELLELVEAESVRLFNSGRQRPEKVFRRHEDLEPEQGRFRTEPNNKEFLSRAHLREQVSQADRRLLWWMYIHWGPR